MPTRMALTFGSPLTASLLAGLFLLGCSVEPTKDPGQSTDDLGARAPDATGMGPLETTSSEYRMPAGIDADIVSGRATEVWARVYRPSELKTAEKHPLLVFLHGNHGTCGTGSNPRIDDSLQYTQTGRCPSGYVVTPNHDGYAYLAERMASWGYIVVSINANRGITGGASVTGDFGLNLVRGRLVLKHLELLSQWNATAGTTPATLGVDLAGMLDFDNVGFMGHSRGGEGVRAAYAQYNDPGSIWPARIRSQLGVKGIFEIGPVDGQTSRKLDALGTAWNVLLPMCDGDVSDLQGMKPFDRMLGVSTESRATPKSMFAVWGANHNFYNTEWQESDSRGCSGTGHKALWDARESASTKQQATGLHALMGFFRAHVGEKAESGFNRNFDPQFSTPQTLDAVTRVERAYADAASASNVVVLEDFTKPAGTSRAGIATVSSSVVVSHGGVPEHDPMLRAGLVTWSAGGAQTYLQIPWSAAGSGVDASQMQTLDFGVSPRGTTAAGLDFSIQLVNADDTLSRAVKLKSYLELAKHGGHVVMNTARIALGDFTGVNLAKVRGVRFVFDGTTQGSAFISAIRFSRSSMPLAGNVTPGKFADLDLQGIPRQTVTIGTGNQVIAVRNLASNEVEVELESQHAFPVADELARLRIGGHDVLSSRYLDEGDMHRLVFTMSPAEFAAAADNAPMSVRYGDSEASYEWDFGTFRRAP